MSTIIFDVVKLEKPIMFSPKTREQYDPEDSQYHRLLAAHGDVESELEVCYWAVRIADAGGCTMLDPHPSFESAGWRWSSFNLCWYNRNTPDNLKFANLITQI